jgi:hypothetical protein
MGYGIYLKVSVVDVYCFSVCGPVDFCHPALDICAVQERYFYAMKQNLRILGRIAALHSDPSAMPLFDR